MQMALVDDSAVLASRSRHRTTLGGEGEVPCRPTEAVSRVLDTGILRRLPRRGTQTLGDRVRGRIQAPLPHTDEMSNNDKLFMKRMTNKPRRVSIAVASRILHLHGSWAALWRVKDTLLAGQRGFWVQSV